MTTDETNDDALRLIHPAAYVAVLVVMAAFALGAASTVAASQPVLPAPASIVNELPYGGVGGAGSWTVTSPPESIAAPRIALLISIQADRAYRNSTAAMQKKLRRRSEVVALDWIRSLGYSPAQFTIRYRFER